MWPTNSMSSLISGSFMLLFKDASITFIIPDSTIVSIVKGASCTKFYLNLLNFYIFVTLNVEKAILINFSLETIEITYIMCFNILSYDLIYFTFWFAKYSYDLDE